MPTQIPRAKEPRNSDIDCPDFPTIRSHVLPPKKRREKKESCRPKLANALCTIKLGAVWSSHCQGVWQTLDHVVGGQKGDKWRLVDCRLGNIPCMCVRVTKASHRYIPCYVDLSFGVNVPKTSKKGPTRRKKKTSQVCASSRIRMSKFLFGKNTASVLPC